MKFKYMYAYGGHYNKHIHIYTNNDWALEHLPIRLCYQTYAHYSMMHLVIYTLFGCDSRWLGLHYHL